MILRCTVRGCLGALASAGDRLLCERGHAFDRAREGYWNLLQPQDRRRAGAGDRDEATAARRRWLARGFAGGLVETIAAAIAKSGAIEGAAIDVGCGEGTLTARLFGGLDVDRYGIDLSAGAIRMAARLSPAITWVVANADRSLPFLDVSAGLALSVFGRRPAAELARVLRPGGSLVVVVPGEDDLIELREAAQGEARRRDRVDAVLAELGPVFDLVARAPWRRRVRHDRAALEDALAMSYRGARHRERARIAGVEGMEVQLSAEILSLVRAPSLR